MIENLFFSLLVLLYLIATIVAIFKFGFEAWLATKLWILWIVLIILLVVRCL